MLLHSLLYTLNNVNKIIISSKKRKIQYQMYMYLCKRDDFVVDYQIQSTVHMSYVYRPATKELMAINNISSNESNQDSAKTNYDLIIYVYFAL